MVEQNYCEHCGALLTVGTGNVVPLRRPQSAGSPQAELIELGDGKVRLRLNLVVSREAAVQVMRLLGETE